MNLRRNIIRLAFARPDLRPHLLGVLTKCAATPSPRTLAPLMAQIVTVGGGVAPDPRVLMKLAEAFIAAIQAAAKETSYIQDGPGAEPDSWVAVQYGKEVFEVVTGYVPSRQTYYGWDPPEDVTAEVEFRFPETVDHSQRVTITYKELLDQIVPAFSRLGVSLRGLSPRDLYEFLHDNTLVVVPFFVAAMQEMVQHHQAEIAESMRLKFDEEDDFFEWPGGVEDTTLKWKWDTQGVQIKNPVITPMGVQMTIVTRGKVVITDLSAVAAPGFGEPDYEEDLDDFDRDFDKYAKAVKGGQRFAREVRGPGGLIFDLDQVGEFSLRTTPTDPYGQVYEGLILTPKAGKRPYKAALEVVREFKDEIMRMKSTYDVYSFVNQKVQERVGKAPSWQFYNRPD